MSSRILVDEIYGKTSGASALTVDSNSRLSQGSPVGFRAKVNPSQSISVVAQDLASLQFWAMVDLTQMVREAQY